MREREGERDSKREKCLLNWFLPNSIAPTTKSLGVQEPPPGWSMTVYLAKSRFSHPSSFSPSIFFNFFSTCAFLSFGFSRFLYSFFYLRNHWQLSDWVIFFFTVKFFISSVKIVKFILHSLLILFLKYLSANISCRIENIIKALD